MKTPEFSSFTDLINPDKDVKATNVLGVNCWTGRINEGTLPGLKSYVFRLSSDEFAKLPIDKRQGFGRNGDNYVSRGEGAESMVNGKKQELTSILGNET